MGRLLLVPVLVLLLVAACRRTTALDEPQIALLAAALDLGRVAGADHYAGHLSLVNASSRPVAIDNIRTDCGCTVADWSDAPIPAGDTLRLPVALDCRGRSAQTHTVEVWLAGVRAPLRATVTAACE